MIEAAISIAAGVGIAGGTVILPFVLLAILDKFFNWILYK